MANNQDRNYSMNNCHNYATITSSIGSSRYEADDVRERSESRKQWRLCLICFRKKLQELQFVEKTENELFSFSNDGIKFKTCMSSNNTNYRQNTSCKQTKITQPAQLWNFCHENIHPKKYWVSVEEPPSPHPPPTVGVGKEDPHHSDSSLAISVNSLSYA